MKKIIKSSLCLSIFIFLFNSCGSTEHTKIQSTPLVAQNGKELSQIEKEIEEIKKNLLDKRVQEELSDKEKDECEKQIEIIAEKLRNFEKIEVDTTEEALMSLGFDMTSPNVLVQSGSKALTLWLGGNTPLIPPLFVMGREIQKEDIDFLQFKPLEFTFKLRLKNGNWNAFWSNREKKPVRGFSYYFEFITLEKKIIGFKKNGGIIRTDEEEYESKKSKIGNALKNPIDWIPRP